MDPDPCRRCLNCNRPEAHYCATCGCRLARDRASQPAPQRRRRSSIVLWMLLITVIVVTLGPPPGDQANQDQSPNATKTGARSRALVGSTAGRRGAGLIIDFPPEYPAEFFWRQAYRGE